MHTNIKPTVLVLAHFYLPGTMAGGPIRSISNLVDNLADIFKFKIVTADRDFGDKFPYKNIETNKWVKIGNAQVYYFYPTFRNLLGIAQLLRSTECSFIYLNSFFDPRFSFWVLLMSWVGYIHKPLLLAPRGEFSPAALNIKSFKKNLYLSCLKKLGILKSVVWQASSTLERLDINRALTGGSGQIDINFSMCNKVRVASDMVEQMPNIFISRNLTFAGKILIPKPNARISSNKKLRICFASRISRMKNLDYALKILSRVRSDVIFNIYGPLENLDYWHECKELIEKLPQNIEVNVLGAYKNEDIEMIFGANDILFLPTQGENFGHVIFEALKFGLPALISDRTLWVDFEINKAGWIGSLSQPDYFVAVIERLAKMSIDELLDFRKGAVDYARNYMQNNAALNETKQLFYYMLTLNSPGL